MILENLMKLMKFRNLNLDLNATTCDYRNVDMRCIPVA